MSEYDHLLKKVPLVFSPYYQPPQKPNLPPDFKSLPESLPPEVLNSNYRGQPIVEDLKAWQNGLADVKSEILQQHKEYDNWVETTVRKHAPGYDSERILQPKKK